MATNKRAVESALTYINNVTGKGMIVQVVWGIPFAGLPHSNQGIVVRQMQYDMDARRFSVTDNGCVRFLGRIVNARDMAVVPGAR